MPHVRRKPDAPEGQKPITVERDNVKNTNALRRRKQRHSGGSLDLSNIDANTLKRTLKVLLERKLGITFGVTRDGDALAIALLDSGETVKEYVRPSDDINAYLTALADDFESDE